MVKRMLTGSFVALITPFQADGAPDIEGFGRLIEFQARNGTGALLIMGSTGEVWLVTKEERHRVITETIPFKRYGLPLFYGCTENNTQVTIAMVDFAARAGADGAVVTAPSYVYAPVDAALRYFLEVADASRPVRHRADRAPARAGEPTAKPPAESPPPAPRPGPAPTDPVAPTAPRLLDLSGDLRVHDPTIARDGDGY